MNDKLLEQLEWLAENGMGVSTPNIHNEKNGVFAVGIRRDKGRIAGFFEGKDFAEFVICGAYEKKGKRGPRGDAVVDRTVELKKMGVIRV